MTTNKTKSSCARDKKLPPLQHQTLSNLSASSTASAGSISSFFQNRGGNAHSLLKRNLTAMKISYSFSRCLSCAAVAVIGSLTTWQVTEVYNQPYQNIDLSIPQPQHHDDHHVSSQTHRLTIDEEVTSLIDQFPRFCRGKKPLLRQIREAGLNITKNVCEGLPTMEDVEDLYGQGPVVVGLETCERYRKLISANTNKNGKAYPPAPKVAGLWNVGTNALVGHLLNNLIGYDPTANQTEATVTWGKHTPLYLKYNITWPEKKPESRDHILPIVVVRDPYRWLQAMVRNDKHV